MTSYRVDYADQDDKLVVLPASGRAHALRMARHLSTKHSLAYAIAKGDDGKDTGQRVYANGSLDSQDGQY